MLVNAFRNKVRHDYELPGEVTIHRATRDDTTGNLVAGPKITQTTITLKKNEKIFVLYDETKYVVPGGLGTGAEIVSHSNQAAIAKGGVGTGGKMDKKKNVKGGDGIGGDGRGKSISGTGGEGYGAHVFSRARGATSEGGAGVGGDLTED